LICSPAHDHLLRCSSSHNPRKRRPMASPDTPRPRSLFPPAPAVRPDEPPRLPQLSQQRSGRSIIFREDEDRPLPWGICRDRQAGPARPAADVDLSRTRNWFSAGMTSSAAPLRVLSRSAILVGRSACHEQQSPSRGDVRPSSSDVRVTPSMKCRVIPIHRLRSAGIRRSDRHQSSRPVIRQELVTEMKNVSPRFSAEPPLPALGVVDHPARFRTRARSAEPGSSRDCCPAAPTRSHADARKADLLALAFLAV